MTLIWTQRDSDSSGTFHGVAHNGSGLWVAVDSDGKVSTSSDGITWTSSDPSIDAYAVAYNGSGLWVAASWQKVHSSPDGITWTQRAANFTSYVWAVAHDGSGLWVVGGAWGELATSPDGINWIMRTTGLSIGTDILGVAHDGSGLWVAVAKYGKIITSPDGITWTLRTSSFESSDIFCVAYDGSGLWVAAGADGKLATSPDGITWTMRTSSFGSDRIRGVAHNGSDLWVIVGLDGKLATSPDGLDWTQRDSSFEGLANEILCVAHNGSDLFVAAGQGGKLATGYEAIPPILPHDIDDYKVIEWKVSKGMDDPFWVAKAKIDKHIVPAFFEKTKVKALDHKDITQTVFTGIIPAIDYQLKTAENKAEIVGYDYAWYLSVQHLPSSMETISIDQNPSKTIEDILGGTNWEKETGIEPYRINTVAAWDDPDNPIKKQFTFQEKTLKWSAIVEIADYCNFVFVVKWREIGGDWRPCAYFVHEDDVDTGGIGLDLPPEMTITAPDKYLINDVEIKDEPIYKYNRVLCVGFSQETSEYFYSTAQTPEVAAGTELPREYTYTGASLNTKAKTEEKAQELLDFFQESWIIYSAKFKNRMDLELYQTLSLGGYERIDSNEMRITAIKYTREAADDVVEIEFSKNQPIQQIKRLQRAMRTRIHYETFISDMWEESGAYAQLIESRPINMQGWGIYNTGGLHGPKNSDVTFRGWRHTDERWVEFLRWDHAVTGKALTEYIRVLEDIVIDNDIGGFPKLHFGIEPDKETFIEGIQNTEIYGMSLIAGGKARGEMLLLVNPVNEEADPYLLLQRKTYLTTDMIIAGKIMAWQSGEEWEDLTFYDNRTGTKTLSDLAGAGLWLNATGELGDFIQVKTPKAIHMAEKHIRYLAHPVYDRDAATKWWVEQQLGESGDVSNPMTTHLYMNGYDIKNCDDIDCDDIDCDDISADNINCDNIECEVIDCTNNGIYNVELIYMEGSESYIDRVGWVDFWSRASAPSSPTYGTLYYHGSTGTFRYWNGSIWKTIATT